MWLLPSGGTLIFSLFNVQHKQIKAPEKNVRKRVYAVTAYERAT